MTQNHILRIYLKQLRVFYLLFLRPCTKWLLMDALYYKCGSTLTIYMVYKERTIVSCRDVTLQALSIYRHKTSNCNSIFHFDVYVLLNKIFLQFISVMKFEMYHKNYIFLILDPSTPPPPQKKPHNNHLQFLALFVLLKIQFFHYVIKIAFTLYWSLKTRTTTHQSPPVLAWFVLLNTQFSGSVLYIIVCSCLFSFRHCVVCPSVYGF